MPQSQSNHHTAATKLLRTAQKQYMEQNIQTANNLCNNILAREPTNIKALQLKGLIAQKQDKIDDAINYLLRAITCDHDNAESHHYLGTMLQAKHHYDQAISYYQQSLTLNSQNSLCHHNLSTAYLENKQFTLALKHSQQAIRLSTKNSLFYFQEGICHEKLHNHDQAIKSYQKTIMLNPHHLGAYNHLAWQYIWKGNEKSAFSILKKALHIDPNSILTLRNLGILAYGFNYYDNALSYYHQLIALEPSEYQYQYLRSIVLLSKGSFPEAWNAYEIRKKLPIAIKLADQYPYPVWKGEDLTDKTLLIVSEQGFGDRLQFYRFIQLIKAKAVILYCHPSHKRLFDHCPYINNTISCKEELPVCDVKISLLSIPYVLQITDKNIYHYPSYLTIDKGLINHWQQKISNPHKFSVGLSWTGRDKSIVHNQLRSIPIEKILSILTINDIDFYSLQVDKHIDIPPSIAEKIIDITDDITDFADTAAIIHNLDLVISIDTAISHLAGAIGQPIWVLLSAMPDWRWKPNNPHWYGNMRTFYQKNINDWTNVIDEVKQALIIELNNRHDNTAD